MLMQCFSFFRGFIGLFYRQQNTVIEAEEYIALTIT